MGEHRHNLGRVPLASLVVEDSVSDILTGPDSPRGPEQRHCVTDPVAYGIAILATVVAAFAVWHMALNRQVGNPLFYAVCVVEIVLVALLVGGSIALAQTSRDVDGVLFVSYLVTMVVIPPAAIVWGIAEKSRWGTGVVVVAMLTTAALSVRLLGIWKGSYA